MTRSDERAGRCKAGLCKALKLACPESIVNSEETMTESPKYQVTQKHGAFELRQYAPYIKAEVAVSGGSYRAAIYKGFGILADYIFGNNIAAEKVAMTSPVQVEESRKIAMTSPVTVSGEGNYTVAFSMPSEYRLETLPLPKNESIRFVEVPAQMVAATRVASFYREQAIEKAKSQLADWVNQAGLQPTGEFSVAGYNPPWVPNFLARSEVMVVVETPSPNPS